MRKVILVHSNDVCTRPVVFRSNELTRATEFVTITTGTEEERRYALARLIEAGDEVFVHRFVRNDEGIPVADKFAVVRCQHGIEKLLFDRLLEDTDETAYDIVSDLAKELMKLARTAG